jgi:hypothetical protein
MKILSTAIVFASLTLIGTLPAVPGQPVSLLPSNTAIRLAADSDSPSDRDSYVQRVKNEMQEWQRKLHDSGEQAEAKTQSAGNSARNELNEAWSKTEAASHRLQTASADGWASAKASFEEASNKLAAAWHKVHPEDKDAGR